MAWGSALCGNRLQGADGAGIYKERRSEVKKRLQGKGLADDAAGTLSDALTQCPICFSGEVPEWLIGAVSKTVVLARAPGVRIPSLSASFLNQLLDIE